MKDPFSEQLLPAVNSEELSALLTESACVALYTRKYSTYYIKASSEVDIAYVSGNSFFPLEIKWRKTVSSDQIKQIKKYKNGVVLGKSGKINEISGIPHIPLPLRALFVF